MARAAIWLAPSCVCGGLWFGLPHAQARPDEVEAVSYALRVAQGDLTLTSSTGRRFTCTSWHSSFAST